MRFQFTRRYFCFGLLLGLTAQCQKGASTLSVVRSITKQDADATAAHVLHEVKPAAQYVILPDSTIERDFGWVYFYVPRRYLETRNDDDLIPGAGPLIVLREDGSTLFLSTSVDPQQGIQIFEEKWRRAKGIR